MTAPVFVDETQTPADIMPDVSDVEYPCSVCGREAGPYGGRGRKPTKCPDHKKSAVTGARAPRISGTNDALARQATEALCSINGMMALGARIVQLTDTADAIEGEEEVFRLRVYTALLNNPNTARKIVSMGGKAGDSALFVALGLHFASIIPVLLKETKTKKAERDARKAEEQEQI